LQGRGDRGRKERGPPKRRAYAPYSPVVQPLAIQSATPVDRTSRGSYMATSPRFGGLSWAFCLHFPCHFPPLGGRRRIGALSLALTGFLFPSPKLQKASPLSTTLNARCYSKFNEKFRVRERTPQIAPRIRAGATKKDQKAELKPARRRHPPKTSSILTS